MRSFTTAIVLLSIFSDFTSAHPSFLNSRAQSKTVKVPIEDLLKGSTIERSGKGDGTIYSFSVPAKKPVSARSESESDLVKRIGNPCANDPCCTILSNPDTFKKEYRWELKNWSQHLGKPQAISQPICPPGSVTNSRTVSYTWSINVNLGPDLKFGPSILDKFGIRVGFAYSWGEATTVGYTALCSDGNDFPCFAYFTPRIGKIYGTGWIETMGTDGKTICSKTEKSEMEISVPILKSDVCKEGAVSKNPCGPEGNSTIRLDD
ncbi:hypothetical protein PtrSN002B_011653 [Pyrenophora tritici-repentis]|uniref:Uncharacterized protein n=1 Tax=Pyrenophora tritici-repentis (strain Pt-1C-BFP) TaxID=426418 RepID=B2W845_PYRTR|nr:uncharacterized protein PTRG_05983 [Pyrenophora tritici-repentis Pt-1C-BFP]EDU48903.1 predicted protein [Pyrenophora tritici-repentis Pt-1C-BFP]KAI1526220.1 hypothetical protein PtrSN002B_011653 [Pyrenophora tritici-repentis]PZD37174.1 hypothetical protein A1F97_07834 [Pyrenophora tritici-repentis]